MALWALFILELTEHPGAKGVFYEDALDAWTAWRHHTTFLPPGPDTNDVVVVRAATRDTVWERAAADADTDHVLAGVGLPGVRDFAHARHIPPDAGGRGTYTDLEHVTSQGPLLVRVATVPPLAIVAVPSGHPDSPLGPSAMAGLADALRSRLTTVGALAAHATLPDHAPLHVQLTVTDEPHQPPGTPSDSDAATAEPGRGSSCTPAPIRSTPGSASTSTRCSSKRSPTAPRDTTSWAAPAPAHRRGPPRP